jgi:hypothetical protein
MDEGLRRVKHDTTTACRQGKVEQVKANVDTVFCLT